MDRLSIHMSTHYTCQVKCFSGFTFKVFLLTSKEMCVIRLRFIFRAVISDPFPHISGF